MSGQWFSDKDPEEVIVLSIGFGPILDNGETISTASWVITRDGVTEVTTGMLSGSTDITASPIVRQKVQAGNDGGTYIHRAKVTTSTGRTLVYGVYQNVKYGA